MNNETTLQEAKTFLRENWEKGTDCPCCGQLVKLYKRPIYGTLAYELIKLYHLDKTKSDYYHITKLQQAHSSGGGDFAKLVYWGLVFEKEKDNDANSRTSGFWGITQKGREFVEKRITVPSHVKIYNGKSLGLTGKQVSIQEVLGKKFDYKELMGDYYEELPEQGALL